MRRRDPHLRPTEGESSCANSRRSLRLQSRVVVYLWVFLVVHPLSGQQVPRQRWPSKLLQRLVAPLRSSPFSQSTVGPCALGLASCFTSVSLPTRSDFERRMTEDSNGPVILQERAGRGGPLAHHWLELDGPEREMTFGFGPATLPFIDSGQVSLQDRFGNVERISGMHPLPWLALPPINYHYARGPGEGRIIGRPIPLTMAQSDALTRKLQHLRFVGPYIPFFHDCRTFTCSVLASAQGHSTLPCYLLFKGYW